MLQTKEQDLGPKAATLTPRLLLLIGATGPIKVDVCTVVLAKAYRLLPVLGILMAAPKPKVVAAPMRKALGVSQKASWVLTGMPKVEHREVEKTTELCC